MQYWNFPVQSSACKKPSEIPTNPKRCPGKDDLRVSSTTRRKIIHSSMRPVKQEADFEEREGRATCP